METKKNYAVVLSKLKFKDLLVDGQNIKMVNGKLDLMYENSESYEHQNKVFDLYEVLISNDEFENEVRFISDIYFAVYRVVDANNNQYLTKQNIDAYNKLVKNIDKLKNRFQYHRLFPGQKIIIF